MPESRTLTGAIPGVCEPADTSPADYERHGSNNLNIEQHVFTLVILGEILRKNNESKGENAWKLDGIAYFVLLNKRSRASFCGHD